MCPTSPVLHQRLSGIFFNHATATDNRHQFELLQPNQNPDLLAKERDKVSLTALEVKTRYYFKSD